MNGCRTLSDRGRRGCLLVAALLAGCATNGYTENGALVGAGLGAGTGAIIGHQSGDGAAGALLGGTLGALGGALIGNAHDAWEQRDAALAQLSAASQPLHPPLTNFDLVRMTQAGLGDEVILNAVQTRGGQFDLSPDGLIALKSSGVSDPVIQFVQTAGSAQVPAASLAGTTVVSAPPQVVVVRPRPVVDVHLGPPPVHIDLGHPAHRHYRHHRHRSGFAFDWHHRF